MTPREYCTQASMSLNGALTKFRLKLSDTKSTTPSKVVFQLPYSSRVSGDIYRRITRCAIQDALDLQRQRLFSVEEADILWEALSQDIPDREIHYKAFKSLKETLPMKFRFLFLPQVFLQLSKPSGYMPVVLFFNFSIKLRKFQYNYKLMILVAVEEAKLDLHSFDASKDGSLTLEQLEQYIITHISTLPRLAISPSFLPFYARTCVKKFQFFHDPHKRSVIPITTLMTCTSMFELFELRGYDLHPEQEVSNWFTIESTFRIYSDYCAIDKDEKGYITLEDALGWSNWSLTDLVTRGVFKEYQSQTPEGELDFEGYLELIIALLYINTPESVKYWFRVIDLDCKGYLTCDDLTRLLQVCLLFSIN